MQEAAPTKKPHEAGLFLWLRERDSNPPGPGGPRIAEITNDNERFTTQPRKKKGYLSPLSKVVFT